MSAADKETAIAIREATLADDAKHMLYTRTQLRDLIAHLDGRDEYSRLRQQLAFTSALLTNYINAIARDCVADQSSTTSASRIIPPPPVSVEEMARPFGPADGSGAWKHPPTAPR